MNPRSSSLVTLLAVALLTAGCPASPPSPDGGPGDAGTDADGEPDGGSDGGSDAGGDAGDGGSDADGGEVPVPGFGDLAGACGVLDDDEWTADAPFLFRNSIDFGTLAFDESLLTPGGFEIWEEGNLGGSSVESEIVAFEVLHRCELAMLLLTESEIVYVDVDGKKTDLYVEIDGRQVGVSVTRAFHYPPEEGYTLTEAAALLEDKLADVLLSAANAAAANSWERSILHIIAWDGGHADAVEAAFAGIDPAVLSDTIVMLTVTDGEDGFVY